MSKEQWNEYAKPIAVLAVICLVTSLLLAVTNSFTAPVIEENERRVAQAAYHELLPTAETFDTVEGWTTPNVLEIVTDPASGSYVIKAQGQGFGGMVPVIVAFGSDGNIIAVKFLENSETKGYGSRLYEQPEWASQFTGMPAENFAISDIDALSGATMSTEGAVAGINAAIDGFNEVKGAA
ncbi:MAG TPA: FMN-binding protein [Candidatus Anaerofilum excrementigallinarum]|nr:FMN-binding protein [Candidatus Anaerofilum excrementigallinarum]